MGIGDTLQVFAKLKICRMNLSENGRSYEKYTKLGVSLQLFTHSNVSLISLSHDGRSHEK
jgi:hypothetical protein